jgi:hypothetical protein
VYLYLVSTHFSQLQLESQPYLCHHGGGPGVACTFELSAPERSKSIPYTHLLSIDSLGNRLITLHYPFAEVSLSIGKDFPGKRQFLDDLANFRVATIRENHLLKISLSEF